MKGVKKSCFGLLLACSIMLGLSLSASSNVNAERYAYNAFPLYHRTVFDDSGTSYFSHNPSFSLWLEGNVPFSYDNLDGKKTNLRSDCTEYSPSYIWSFGYVSSRDYSYLSSGQINNFNRPLGAVPSNFPCLDKTASWDYDGIYSAKFNLTTGEPVKLVSLDVGTDDYHSLIPYGYSNLKKIEVDLPISDSNVTNVTPNTPLVWEFGLVTYGSRSGVSAFDYFDSSLSYSMSLQYFDSSGNVVSDVASCNLNTNYSFELEQNLTWEDQFSGFSIVCSYTPSTSFSQMLGHLIIYGGNSDSNPSVFLRQTHGLFFGSSFLITNNNDTWSGLTANDDVTGDNLDSAPGHYQLYGPPEQTNCNPGDWFCNLSGMFGFTFTNPFTPIFSLFTDNQSCAQIPTISSMIHSHDTQVCPWFPSSVRSLLTPIFGLSSSMLIFGFAVRWLGSSSGNFFEDSSGETLTYSNWYSDGRGFHRTKGSPNRRINK